MPLFSRITQRLGWNRTSAALMSGFLLVILLILYIWWPLVVDYLATYDPRYPFWVQVDWLLIAIFAVLSLLITARPNLRHDLPILLIGSAGGLVIETWGTQAGLWAYFTGEAPPFWIIPAWPIASLAIDRIDHWLRPRIPALPTRLQRGLYAAVFSVFFVLMLPFIWPGRADPLTVMALVLCLLLILTPIDTRAALLTFTAGAALGYFLERWGTTRECWVYWTHQTPPFFAVLAHGMAAVAFARTQQTLALFLRRLWALIPRASAGWQSRAN